MPRIKPPINMDSLKRLQGISGLQLHILEYLMLSEAIQVGKVFELFFTLNLVSRDTSLTDQKRREVKRRLSFLKPIINQCILEITKVSLVATTSNIELLRILGATLPPIHILRALGSCEALSRSHANLDCTQEIAFFLPPLSQNFARIFGRELPDGLSTSQIIYTYQREIEKCLDVPAEQRERQRVALILLGSPKDVANWVTAASTPGRVFKWVKQQQESRSGHPLVSSMGIDNAVRLFQCIRRAHTGGNIINAIYSLLGDEPAEDERYEFYLTKSLYADAVYAIYDPPPRIPWGLAINEEIRDTLILYAAQSGAHHLAAYILDLKLSDENELTDRQIKLLKYALHIAFSSGQAILVSDIIQRISLQVWDTIRLYYIPYSLPEKPPIEILAVLCALKQGDRNSIQACLERYLHQVQVNNPERPVEETTVVSFSLTAELIFIMTAIQAGQNDATLYLMNGEPVRLLDKLNILPREHINKLVPYILMSKVFIDALNTITTEQDLFPQPAFLELFQTVWESMCENASSLRAKMVQAIGTANKVDGVPADTVGLLILLGCSEGDIADWMASAGCITGFKQVLPELTQQQQMEASIAAVKSNQWYFLVSVLAELKDEILPEIVTRICSDPGIYVCPELARPLTALINRISGEVSFLLPALIEAINLDRPVRVLHAIFSGIKNKYPEVLSIDYIKTVLDHLLRLEMLKALQRGPHMTNYQLTDLKNFKQRVTHAWMDRLSNVELLSISSVTSIWHYLTRYHPEKLTSPHLESKTDLDYSSEFMHIEDFDFERIISIYLDAINEAKNEPTDKKLADIMLCSGSLLCFMTNPVTFRSAIALLSGRYSMEERLEQLVKLLNNTPSITIELGQETRVIQLLIYVVKELQDKQGENLFKLLSRSDKDGQNTVLHSVVRLMLSPAFNSTHRELIRKFILSMYKKLTLDQIKLLWNTKNIQKETPETLVRPIIAGERYNSLNSVQIFFLVFFHLGVDQPQIHNLNLIEWIDLVKTASSPAAILQALTQENYAGETVLHLIINALFNRDCEKQELEEDAIAIVELLNFVFARLGYIRTVRALNKPSTQTNHTPLDTLNECQIHASTLHSPEGTILHIDLSSPERATGYKITHLAVDMNSNTLFHNAARQGVDALNAIKLTGAPLELLHYPNLNGDPVIIHILRHPSDERILATLKWLIAHGSRCNIKDKEGYSCLQIYQLSGQSTEIEEVTRLLSANQCPYAYPGFPAMDISKRSTIHQAGGVSQDAATPPRQLARTSHEQNESNKSLEGKTGYRASA